MPIDKHFRYNEDAHPSVQWGALKPKSLGGDLQVIVTKDGDKFSASLPWVDKYAPIFKISSEETLGDWQRDPMKWWQTQVNLAVWCATAGCGVYKG
jgi:hypothetical protein